MPTSFSKVYIKNRIFLSFLVLLYMKNKIASVLLLSHRVRMYLKKKKDIELNSQPKASLQLCIIKAFNSKQVNLTPYQLNI